MIKNTHFPPCIHRPVNAQNIQSVFRSIIFLPINANKAQFFLQFHCLFITQKTLQCVPLVFHSVNESKWPLLQHLPLCGDRQTTGYWSEYGIHRSSASLNKHGCFHPAIFENSCKLKKNGKADVHLHFMSQMLLLCWTSSGLWKKTIWECSRHLVLFLQLFLLTDW